MSYMFKIKFEDTTLIVKSNKSNFQIHHLETSKVYGGEYIYDEGDGDGHIELVTDPILGSGKAMPVRRIIKELQICSEARPLRPKINRLYLENHKQDRKGNYIPAPKNKPIEYQKMYSLAKLSDHNVYLRRYSQNEIIEVGIDFHNRSETLTINLLITLRSRVGSQEQKSFGLVVQKIETIDRNNYLSLYPQNPIGTTQLVHRLSDKIFSLPETDTNDELKKLMSELKISLVN